MVFEGFPRDTLYTPTPDPLFGPLLEDIQDLAELKVTLRGIWLLHHKRQGPRSVSLEEFLSDPALQRGLQPGAAPGSSDGAADEIRRGLRMAVRRGVFLVHGSGPDDSVFVLNNDVGRRAVSRMRESGTGNDAGLGADEAPARPRERLNIFALYEDTIGMLTPIVAERLKEAEGRYPPGWIREAFDIAALENKRSWQYIAAILARWGSEGKGNWPGGSSKQDGKPGRNSPQDQRKKYSQDYERRRGRASPRTGTR
jgi:DnaD/phage-associated family protein